jgi:FhuF 2Fe-2S C-terminal domain
VTYVPAEPAGPEQVYDALLAAAQTGPFFRLEVGAQMAGPDWQPVRKLPAGGLTSLAAATADQLGTAEVRVAASVLHLSLAARLWAPALASGLLSGVVPDLSAVALSTTPPVRLALPDPSGRLAGSAIQVAELAGATVGDQLHRLEPALPVPLPDGLLRGNSASAMIGALQVLTSAHPGLAGPAAELASALLSGEDLRGAGVLSLSKVRRSLSFRRRSCCLYYRVPGGGLCGDCCLARPPDRTADRGRGR